jgi:hypothetical protein
MTASPFNPDVIIGKLDFFYERGQPDKARRLLLESWPAMQDDLSCLYQHLLIEAQAGGEIPLLLKSASLNDDVLTYELDHSCRPRSCWPVWRTGGKAAAAKSTCRFCRKLRCARRTTALRRSLFGNSGKDDGELIQRKL